MKASFSTRTLDPTFFHLFKEFAPVALPFLSYMVNFSFCCFLDFKINKQKHQKIISIPPFLPLAASRLCRKGSLKKKNLYLLSPTPLLPLFLKHILNFGYKISLKLLFSRTFIVSTLLNLMVNSHLICLINSTWHSSFPLPLCQPSSLSSRAQHPPVFLLLSDFVFTG